MRALVMGWFSFELYGATAGDLLVRDLATQWLQEAGCESDVALAPPFTGGVDWRSVDPHRYSHLVFVCGPFGDNEVTREFLERFKHCRKYGLNLTMLQSPDQWNPFDVLLERDSSRTVRPDASFLASTSLVPVVGLVLVHPQKEYGARGQHERAGQLIRQLIASRPMAVVRIDTRLDENRTGLRTPAEVESLIGRMDVVLTTRLHGTVLAIKNGVPPVVIDPVAGGAKVYAQAKRLGWPLRFKADAVTPEQLQKAYDFCLTPAARTRVRACGEQARVAAQAIRAQFLDELRRPN